MKWNLHFKKLYRRHTVGQSIDAIITYASRPYERRVGKEELLFQEGKPEVRYEHRLLIDLWFTTIRFDWKGDWEWDVQ
jgi:hypothetical protein